MSPLANEERLLLLRLARQALETRLKNNPPSELPRKASGESAALRQRVGVFVSLHLSGELRGCVGFVEPRQPLHRAVIDSAVAAATRDPRFPPLAPAELPEVDVEISVVSQPRPVTVEEIRIGLHGLIVTLGRARGLLLPQVAAERNWSPERFLEETCRKAGLAADSWKGEARVEAFEADVFSERTLSREMPG
jgi:uncharacterized protein